MTFEEFLRRYEAAPLIESSTFALTAADPNQLRFQVSYWQKRGYLHALKRGIYVLDARYRKAELSPLSVANYLVEPSYLSLEFALSYHGLIPEQARVYTSVTTKHTRTFTNVLGTFAYRTLKRSLFFGYEPRQAGTQEVLIATPEKALLDYLYLNAGSLDATAEQVESLRLQNLEALSWKDVASSATRFPIKVQRLAGLAAGAARAAEPQEMTDEG